MVRACIRQWAIWPPGISIVRWPHESCPSSRCVIMPISGHRMSTGRSVGQQIDLLRSFPGQECSKSRGNLKSLESNHGLCRVSTNERRDKRRNSVTHSPPFSETSLRWYFYTPITPTPSHLWDHTPKHQAWTQRHSHRALRQCSFVPVVFF